MYGNLHEFDIRSLLELIERNQGTGQLLVQTEPKLPTTSEKYSFAQADQSFWLIFFKDGQITYAACNHHLPLQRLQDYLRPYHLESAWEHLPDHESNALPLTSSPLVGRTLPEYHHLWLLLEHHILDASQGKEILENLVDETLFDLLSLGQADFIFQRNTVLQPQLTTIDINSALSKVTRRLQQWKQLHPYIKSAEQCPLITKDEELKQALTPSAYRSLAVACQGELSLRRIARYLKKDLLTISQALYPYIQRGWLQLLVSPQKQPQKEVSTQASALPPSSTKVVCCVSQQKEIIDQVKFISEQQGYQIILAGNPAEALSVIVRSRPNLIFLTLETSFFSTEDLIRCLRSQPKFTKVPAIAIISEQADPLRLAKAQLLGVTEFLPCPLQESQLLYVFKKYTRESKKKN